MKIVRLVIVAILALSGAANAASNERSQINPNFINNGGEFIFLNTLEAFGWSNGDSAPSTTPDELDANGYPVFGARGLSPGMSVTAQLPSQYERPGDYVVIHTGAAHLNIHMNFSTAGVFIASCIGICTAPNNIDNTQCSDFTGSIAGNILTVTAAPRGMHCGFQVGEPISSAKGMIESGSYDAATGIATLRLHEPLNVSPGDSVTIENMTGTGFVDYLNQTFKALAGTAGTTLKVQTLPDRPMTIGKPDAALSNNSVQAISVGQFGLPTIITGMAGTPGCSATGTGGAGTYCLNVAQTVASRAMHPGQRIAIRLKPPYPNNNFNVTGPDGLFVNMTATGTAADRSNTAQYFAVLYAGAQRDGCPDTDEHVYWTGRLVGCKFASMVGKSGLDAGTIRDLNLSGSFSSSCTTWAANKPTTHGGLGSGEFRKADYGGVPKLTTNRVSFTASIGKSADATAPVLDVTTVTYGTLRVGQYLTGNPGVRENTRIKYQISGPPGGAGRYLLSAPTQNVASETMSLSSSDYSIDLGRPPQDKQTVILSYKESAGPTATLSTDGGKTRYPLLWASDVQLFGTQPRANTVGTATFDATLRGWLISAGGANGFNYGTLSCGVPPQAFSKIAHELGMNVWAVEPIMASDPATDYMQRYAYYVHDFFPSMIPTFEAINENWNIGTWPWSYSENKQFVYCELDPAAWGPSPCAGASLIGNNNFYGKILSVLGQAVSKAYGNDRTKYRVAAGLFTIAATFDLPDAAHRLTSDAYLKQDTAKIPIQPGYSQTPAYLWTTHVATAPYWNAADYGRQEEVAAAYKFFTASTADQAAIMATYLNNTDPHRGTTIGQYLTIFPVWERFAASCGTTAFNSRTTYAANTSVNFNGHIYLSLADRNDGYTPSSSPKYWRDQGVCGIVGQSQYEGGFQEPPPHSDMTLTIKAAQVNGGNCLLVGDGSGAVAGMTVMLSRAQGGRWASIDDRIFTVQVTGLSPRSIPINLDCSSLGTLKELTLTYLGSANYLTYFRNRAYAAPEQATLTQRFYTDFLNSNGVAPSQFNVGSPNSWGIAFNSLHGPFSVASTSSSSIFGTTLTLGGHVNGGPITITSAQYDAATGLVALTLSHGLIRGAGPVTISNVSGTGSIRSLNGTFAARIVDATHIVVAIEPGLTLAVRAGDVAAISGRCMPGMQVIGQGVPLGTMVVRELSGDGTRSGDRFQVSKPAQIASEAISCAIVTPFPSFDGIKAFNAGRTFLLNRDLHHDGDNTPTFLARAA